MLESSSTTKNFVFSLFFSRSPIFIKTFINKLSSFIHNTTKSNTPVPEIRYVPVTDSTAINELVLTKELLRRTQDSLNAYKSDTTISADYFVAKYELERIRYYNDIAGKGNNIKYLRGWIRRTLEE